MQATYAATLFDEWCRAGLRDVVSHGYFGLDQERLWPIVRDEVPKLLAAIEAELVRGAEGT